MANPYPIKGWNDFEVSSSSWSSFCVKSMELDVVTAASKKNHELFATVDHEAFAAVVAGVESVGAGPHSYLVQGIRGESSNNTHEGG